VRGAGPPLRWASIPELGEDLLGLREATGLVLRVDPLAVHDDIEDPVVTFDELWLYAYLVLDEGRQTGGLGQVVSTHAVLDEDLHPGHLRQLI
jgi:hypothetical protein